MPRSPRTLAMVRWDETVSGPGVCPLSKVVSIVALYCKCARALTFENSCQPAKAPSSADGLEAGLLQRAARAVICGLHVANAIQASEGEESRETKETTLQADEEIWSASRPTTSASGEEWSASRPTTSASAFDASRPTTSASAASAGSVNSQGRRITEKEKQRLEKKEEDKRRRAELRRQAEEAEEQRKRDEAERLRLLQEEAERGVDYVYR
jgi:hypothetical protein